ncbi:MAG: hydrogenase maturation nickel metallochaperone HypA [Chloroflexi bacterium]|nr:hydrogenase maturation nickel metallochaperone HypA [Chloroflexota bacterium]
MHELPVTQSILEIALRYAGEKDARRITHLYLVIGDLSSILDDSVQFYWDIISRGTIAEGAVLHFQRVPTRMVCFECGSTYLPERGTLACPVCNSALVQVAAGDEFRLDAIDIETDD